jgi:hypothetical protein
MRTNEHRTPPDPADDRENAPDRPRADFTAIQAFVALLPDRDSRSLERIIGYDGFGLPS